MVDMTAASDGELQRVSRAIEREVERREGLGADARVLQLQTEMAEIDAGTRLPYDEHLRAASPTQMADWLAAGRLEHLGYRRSKRRGVR